ncbi:MAG: hypothetical protein FWC34_08905 [Bacteroidetes bacterium]|nr:hypothetical protein [Bacteroidota bacterium]MCL2303466.1 hypothetical protein [Lentimicrobiaceae bacterium]
MRKIVTILSILAFLVNSCGQATNKQHKNIVETQQDISEKSDLESKLREKYLHFFENYGYSFESMEYYKNIDCIGLGVVSAKGVHFQLIVDTISMQKIEIKNIKTQDFLIPLFWKPEHMTVVEISENWYEIRANTEMTVWVNKSEFNFYTWEDLLKGNTTCILADIVYMEKDIHSDFIEQREDNTEYALIVEKVEGNWVYVKAETADEIIIDRYWVRWKDENNKLLIIPIFLP